jgi:MFS family permease
MNHNLPISPLRVLLPVGIGTCLSLLGDASIYAVLPSQTVGAGVSIASLGILLSANRFVRLFSNGPAGVAYDRGRRRRLFVSALFLGGLSTALYALSQGFWLLLVGRLLWGLVSGSGATRLSSTSLATTRAAAGLVLIKYHFFWVQREGHFWAVF